MRKVKIEITTKLPSWHFCNSEKAAGLKVSGELCRFCQKTKNGHKCLLYDKWLTSDRGLVDKTSACIKAAVHGTTAIVDHELPQVDPKYIIKESLKTYKQTVNGLLNQGYPQNLAEDIAMKYVLGEDTK